MSRILQFSISPVQEFIARSRRTRDLLCSSFLLSYLSGHAMMHVIKENGTIQFPVVQQDGEMHNPLLLAIEGKRLNHQKGPWVGSLPNRFQAEIPDHFHPDACTEAVQQAWKKIADILWKRLVAPVSDLGKETFQIWQRQVDFFWEIHWVIGEQSDLLRRRKYWRDFVPTVKKKRKRMLEEGDKCMLFPYLQELSGYTGVGRKGKHRKKQQKFWSALRNGIDHELDLRENERLSAIGMIKRFLPVYAEEAIGWRFPEEAEYFPSTQVLASLPWRKKVLLVVPEQAEQYAKEAEKVLRKTSISAKRFFPDNPTHPWVLMDYRAIQPNELKLKPEWKTLKERFLALCQEVGSEPGNYYAILLMDGDQMGELLKVRQQSKKVSLALADFTQAVEKVVRNHSGVLIYAGGDDVLALFPYDQVLTTAIQLREKFRQSFQEYVPSLRSASISASVVFTDQKTPFQQVIPYAHHQLDQIAKEKHGRNSLVVSLYGHSGEIVQWAAPWKKAICPNKKQIQLEVLAETLPLSQSFLHQCKQELEPLSAVLSNQELSQVAISEWERVYRKNAEPAVQKAITSLIELGSFMRYERKQVGDKVGTVKVYEHQFSAAVARLIAWLRQKRMFNCMASTKKVIET